jgi:DNA-directed RNA polymerase specialized sigma subunit
MEQTIRQHAPSFLFSSQNEALTETEVKEHLNASKKSLHQCQNESEDLRFRSYLDLLKTYVNDRNPDTREESHRRAKIVQNTIRSERSRAMHRNIKQVVKPETYGGLSKLMVPRHR